MGRAERNPNLPSFCLPSWPREGVPFPHCQACTLGIPPQPGSLIGTVWASWVLCECASCVPLWLLPATLWESLGSRSCVFSPSVLMGNEISAVPWRMSRFSTGRAGRSGGWRHLGKKQGQPVHQSEAPYPETRLQR